MQHKDLGNLQCPIARSLERVGEWWSILILRDAFQGLTRFDQFQKSLGIAPNMLTRRLNTLVDSGLLERRPYSERPLRHEYVLTPRGRDFRTVIWALLAWGNKHFAPEGETIVVVDTATGERAEPVVVDGRSGRPLRAPEFAVVPGPAANEHVRRRYATGTGAPLVNWEQELTSESRPGTPSRFDDAPRLDPGKRDRTTKPDHPPRPVRASTLDGAPTPGNAPRPNRSARPRATKRKKAGISS
jgi:DNA-binding HxlR family transcriptional regulator